MFYDNVIEGAITDFEREHFRKTCKFICNKELAHLPEDARILFARLENHLSPENLCCDGELPRSEVTRKYRSLMKQWRTLEKKYKVKAEPYV